MKGTLRSLETGKYFTLNPFRTKLGKENCDLNIKSFAIESEHAVIQYDCHLQCYFIEDLNTSYGTYVNDCRVQNAAVRLAHGDIIRLGQGGPRFEVRYSATTWDCPLSQSLNQSSRSAHTPKPPSNSRPLTAHPGQNNSKYLSHSTHVFSQDDLNNDIMAISKMHEQLDLLNNDLHNQMAYKIDNMQNENMVDALRNEVTAIRRDKLGLKYKGVRYLHNDHVLSLLQSRIAQQSYRNRLLDKNIRKSKPTPDDKFDLQFEERKKSGSHEDEVGETEVGLTSTVNEKHQLNTEISLLKKDNALKDLMLQKLEWKADSYLNELKNKEHEISLLKKSVHSEKSNLAFEEMKNRISFQEDRIVELENDLNLSIHKKDQLVDDVSLLKKDIAAKDLMLQKEKQRVQLYLNDLKNKELEIADLSLKEPVYGERSSFLYDELKNKISYLEDRTLELENDLHSSFQEKRQLSDDVSLLKKDVASKDLVIQNIERKAEKYLKELKNKEQEIASLSLKINHQGKLKEMENEVKRKEEEVATLKHKVSLLNRALKDKDSTLKNCQQSLSEANDNIQHLEKIKMKDDVIQKVNKLAVADGKKYYSISDVDSICNFISDIQHDRDHFKTQLKQISQEKVNLEKCYASFEQVEVLKESLSRIERRLGENGRFCKNLLKEHDWLKGIDVHDQLKWIKDLFVSLLASEYAWERDIEHSLEIIGEEKLSVDPSVYITNLKHKINDQRNKIIELEKRLNDTSDLYVNIKKKLSEKHKKDTEKALKDLKESEEKKFENERRRLKQQEAEHVTEALKTQRDSYEKRNEDMALVAKKINRLKEKHRFAQEEFAILQNELNQSKSNEESLKQSLKDSEASLSNLKEILKKKYYNKYENELVKLNSEIKEYVMRIQQLEDKIDALSKEKNDLELTVMKHSKKEKKHKQDSRNSVIYQQEILDLTNQNNELRQRLLKSEKECQEHKELAKTLNNDLNGVSARILHIKGELSEEQKHTIEDLQNEIQSQNKQLDEHRKQLLELSTVVKLQKKKLIEQDTQIVKQSKILALQAEHMREINKPPASLVTEGISTQKINIAERCLSENHDQVIQQQKRAIADLRKAIKSYEHLQPKSESESLISKIRSLDSKKTQPSQLVTARIKAHFDTEIY
ncbi:forkhead-associated domain-containing protein 1 isoform X2 [Hydra vulgaris]|uniref:Forkhead-associated domain-containing protein 1 isoform X2 n=1 Tax=Hydra vulgaris TaxID=6087 RepID=A0ABM4BEJ1_HYDVU